MKSIIIGKTICQIIPNEDNEEYCKGPLGDGVFGIGKFYKVVGIRLNGVLYTGEKDTEFSLTLLRKDPRRVIIFLLSDTPGENSTQFATYTNEIRGFYLSRVETIEELMEHYE